jgi:hypothetical protein
MLPPSFAATSALQASKIRSDLLHIEQNMKVRMDHVAAVYLENQIEPPDDLVKIKDSWYNLIPSGTLDDDGIDTAMSGASPSAPRALPSAGAEKGSTPTNAHLSISNAGKIKTVTAEQTVAALRRRLAKAEAMRENLEIQAMSLTAANEKAREGLVSSKETLENMIVCLKDMAAYRSTALAARRAMLKASRDVTATLMYRVEAGEALGVTKGGEGGEQQEESSNSSDTNSSLLSAWMAIESKVRETDQPAEKDIAALPSIVIPYISERHPHTPFAVPILLSLISSAPDKYAAASYGNLFGSSLHHDLTWSESCMPRNTIVRENEQDVLEQMRAEVDQLTADVTRDRLHNIAVTKDIVTKKNESDGICGRIAMYRTELEAVLNRHHIILDTPEAKAASNAIAEADRAKRQEVIQAEEAAGLERTKTVSQPGSDDEDDEDDEKKKSNEGGGDDNTNNNGGSAPSSEQNDVEMMDTTNESGTAVAPVAESNYASSFASSNNAVSALAAAALITDNSTTTATAAAGSDGVSLEAGALTAEGERVKDNATNGVNAAAQALVDGGENTSNGTSSLAAAVNAITAAPSPAEGGAENAAADAEGGAGSNKRQRR